MICDISFNVICAMSFHINPVKYKYQMDHMIFEILLHMIRDIP